MAKRYEAVVQGHAMGGNATYLKHYVPSASNYIAQQANAELNAELDQVVDNQVELSHERYLNEIDNYANSLDPETGQPVTDSQLATLVRKGLDENNKDIKALTGKSDRAFATNAFDKLLSIGKHGAAEELLFQADEDGISLMDTKKGPEMLTKLHRLKPSASEQADTIGLRMAEEWAPLQEAFVTAHADFKANPTPENKLNADIQYFVTQDALKAYRSNPVVISSAKLSTQVTRQGEYVEGIYTGGFYSGEQSDPKTYGSLLHKWNGGDLLPSDVELAKPYLTEKDYAKFYKDIYADPNDGFRTTVQGTVERLTDFGEVTTFLDNAIGVKNINDTIGEMFMKDLMYTPSFQRAYSELDPIQREELIAEEFLKWQELPKTKANIKLITGFENLDQSAISFLNQTWGLDIKEEEPVAPVPVTAEDVGELVDFGLSNLGGN
jgi:hypothetical protein